MTRWSGSTPISECTTTTSPRCASRKSLDGGHGKETFSRATYEADVSSDLNWLLGVLGDFEFIG